METEASLSGEVAATDCAGATVTGTFAIATNDLNDAPVAADDAAAGTVNEDTALTILAANLIGNDLDADGDVLSIASVSDGVGGSAALDGGGNVVDRVDWNFAIPEEDSIQVSVDDIEIELDDPDPCDDG